MTEDEVREIVREEILCWWYGVSDPAAAVAARDQSEARSRELAAERARTLAADPGDGPVTQHIKQILRGEAVD